MPKNNALEKGISLIQQGRVQDALKVLEEVRDDTQISVSSRTHLIIPDFSKAAESEMRLKRQTPVVQSKSLDQLVDSLGNFGSLAKQAPSSSQVGFLFGSQLSLSCNTATS